MIKIKKASKSNTEILALLGTVTYTESHGQFIENKSDLVKYNKTTFSISKIKEEVSDSKNHFYIIYVDDLPVGYAKLVLNKVNENVVSTNNCCLEKIYILSEFIPLKIGQQFLTFLIEKAKELNTDTMWLSVYIENYRAIKFYQKNEFKNIGKINFLVNGKEYENTVFSKKI